MKHIELSSQHITVISDEDYDFLMQWTWRPLITCKTYAYRSIRDRGVDCAILMHRVILERQGLLIAENEVDHIDRNGLNNQRNNLESVTRAVNQQRAGVRKDSTSGIKGINFDSNSNKWRARLQINGNRIDLGLFTTIEVAISKLDEIKRRLNYGKA